MILFVGQDPGSNRNDYTSSKAFSDNSPSSQRLREWIKELEIVEYDSVNVSRKGRRGSVQKSEYELERLRAYCSDKIVIALGNVASEALSMIDQEHFKLPHPSPLNRQINDTMYIKDQLEKCKKYVYFLLNL